MRRVKKISSIDDIDTRLSKLEERHSSSLSASPSFDKFKDKIFWCNLTGNTQDCCFNHIIGLPRKDGIEKEIFDYEMELVNALDRYQNIWVKKARGLGITEILLRYMSWLAVRNNDYSGCRFHIVTGPRINLAEELVDRIHGLFMNNNLGIECKQVGPIIHVNKTLIQAFPSHTVSTMRGYTDVKLILIDEGCYFPVGQQDEVVAVVEGYRAKTDPKIVIVSTPYKPAGFFYDIDKDLNSPYHKLEFPYQVGIGKIYDADQISKEIHQPYFEREYNLKYSTGVGNVFIEDTLQQAEQLGKEYWLKYGDNVQDLCALGIDPGFGSSTTGFCLIEFIDGLVRVVHTKTFEHATIDAVVNHAYNLIARYNLNNGINKVFVDGNWPGIISSIKKSINEHADYHVFVEKSKRDKIDLFRLMNIVPVVFGGAGGGKHRQMLGNVKKWMDLKRMAIEPIVHKDLLTEMRLATSDETMDLDKSEFSMDLLDALRLSMEFIKY